MRRIGFFVGISLLSMTLSGNAFPQQSVIEELDAYWQEVARTVAEGDFEAYARGYHESAVYVSQLQGVSQPIASVMERWQSGFIETREGRVQSSVEFRFSQRLHDDSTAHETGIFRYQSSTGADLAPAQFMHFEALLVKQDGWLTLMEYQKSAATEADWNALEQR
jgi:hypothetical protein